MKKGELVASIAESTGVGRTQVESVLKATLDNIVESVARGDAVTLTGFGTFERRERSARTGRNPQTGDTIKIKASRVPAFRAGSEFRSVVNGAAKKGAAKKSTAKKSTARKR